MTCSCPSNRTAVINAKVDDQFTIGTSKVSYDGYVPRDINLGRGDYLKFHLCLDCGKIKGTWPVTDEQLQYAINPRPVDSFDSAGLRGASNEAWAEGRAFRQALGANDE